MIHLMMSCFFFPLPRRTAAATRSELRRAGRARSLVAADLAGVDHLGVVLLANVLDEALYISLSLYIYIYMYM